MVALKKECVTIGSQAGAELCKAQNKLRLAKPALPCEPAKIGFSGQAWLV
jgi:hypothetical protein